MDDLKFTEKDTQLINDLKVQAMMFSMAIDWETLELQPIKKPEPPPIWIRKWQEKLTEGDQDVIDNGF